MPRVALVIEEGDRVANLLQHGDITSWGKRVGVVSALTVLVLAGASTLAPLPAGHADTGSEQQPPALSDSSWAPDERTATAVAEKFGHAVGVDSETTETSLVQARPDGSMNFEADSVPARVKVDDAWKPVDPTLKQLSNGLLAPAAAAAQVRFGGGGSNVLAKVQTPKGDWMTETWPGGELPAPRVNGASATYPEIAPGVDLELTATASGMSEVLVIRTAQAADNPELATLDLGIQGAAVATNASQSTVATAPDGSSVSSSSPTWWDSSHAGSSASGPGGDGGLRPVPHSVDTDSLTLDIGKLADSAEPTYPIYVDPDWTPTGSPYWFTDRAYPNQSYLNGQQADGIQSEGYGGGYLSHAFWQFNTSPLIGKTIQAAHFNLTELYSNSCENSLVQVWRYGPSTPGFTWNTEPNAWDQLLDAENEPYGSSCLAAQAISFNPIVGVQWAAANGQSTLQLGMRAADETDPLTRKHWSQAATLSVTYDSPPNTPTSLALASPPRGCGTSSQPAYINGKQTLVFTDYVTDPDSTAATVNSTFYVYDAAAPSTLLATYYARTHAQGTQTTTDSNPTTVTYQNGHTYQWRAVAGDGTLLSAMTGWCYFTVKQAPPALPTVDSQTSANVGSAVTVTVHNAAADGVKAYVAWWGYDGAQQTPPTGNIAPGAVPACTATGTAIGTAKAYCPDPTTGEATIGGDPVNTTARLWIAAYDAAGNVSTSADGQTPAGVGVDFQVGPDGNVNWSHGHAWSMDAFTDSAHVTSPVPDLATSGGTPLSVGAGTSWSMQSTSPFTSNEAISLPGYLTLSRYYGSFHSGAVEGGAPAGSHLESVIGQMLRYTGPSKPANELIVYQCTLTNGTDMTSTNPGCEGLAGTATPIGYIYNGPPTGIPSVEIFRCHTAVDHFDTTASNCEGSAYDGVLGWFLRIAPTQATTTAGYVVDTTQSYSVGAWLTAASDNTGQANYTALSQAGAANSGFYLQESAGYWRFCVRSQTAAATTVCATSPQKASFGTAQLVTGIWDAPNNQVRLLVSSSIQPVAVASYVPPTGDSHAVGPLLVGSAISNYSPVNMFNGQIGDPFVFPGVIDSDALTALSNGTFSTLNR